MRDDDLISLVDQRRDGESGEQFARSIGVHPSYWSRLRQRQAPITVRFLRGVYRRFPNLGPAILSFLERG